MTIDAKASAAPRDQRDPYDDQRRNVAQQIPVLGSVRHRLHRHYRCVNQARPCRKQNEAAVLRGVT